MATVQTRWGPWSPDEEPCPECGDGDAVPEGHFRCGTCDAEWPDEDEPTPTQKEAGDE